MAVFSEKQCKIIMQKLQLEDGDTFSAFKVPSPVSHPTESNFFTYAPAHNSTINVCVETLKIPPISWRILLTFDRSPINLDETRDRQLILKAVVCVVNSKTTDVYQKYERIISDHEELSEAYPPYFICYESCELIIVCALSVSYIDDLSDIPYTSLADDMGMLLTTEKLFDLTIQSCGKEFRVHRALLAARSPVFAAMLEHDTLEKMESKIVIEDISSEVMPALMRYLYTDEVDDLTPQTALDLFVAADKYSILRLKKICSDFLSKNLSVDSALDVLAIANLHEERDLKRAAIAAISINCLSIMETEKWMDFLTTYPRLANEIMIYCLKRKNDKKSDEKSKSK